MAGARCLLEKPGNFQSSSMLDGEEAAVEGGATASTAASTISACKKVLCANGALDSCDYWLQNPKALCRLGLLEGDVEAGCTLMCFVSLDPQQGDCRDEGSIQKLASVSPELPKLSELLALHQPKDNEILLVGGQEASPAQPRSSALCLLQCSAPRRSAPPAAVVVDINKFLMGLQWGRDRGRDQRERRRPRLDDDANRSVSSVEDDFLTASEHLGEDSEDDGTRNDVEDERHCVNAAGHRGAPPLQQQQQDSAHHQQRWQRRPSLHAKESAGHYATNLAESVLQDAFIRLSQDETSFVSQAAISMSGSAHRSPDSAALPTRSQQQQQRQRACSFELPKIVIVQSPDPSEGAGEWAEPQLHQQDVAVDGGEALETEVEAVVQLSGHQGGNASQHRVEVALACAANVIGTIMAPQLTEQLAADSASEGEEPEEEVEGEEPDGGGAKYSFSSAVCGMARVVGAVAAVELSEELPRPAHQDLADAHTASRGLILAAEASAAIPLHGSVTAGTSVEAFRSDIAQVLHQEAAAVLLERPQGYGSVGHLLEATQRKILDGIANKSPVQADKREVEQVAGEVADSLFRHALEKAKKKRKEAEGSAKDAAELQVFLQDSVNGVLFDVLRLTQKKISLHVSESEREQRRALEVEEQPAIGESKNLCQAPATLVPGAKEKIVPEDADVPSAWSCTTYSSRQNLSKSTSTSSSTRDQADHQTRDCWGDIQHHNGEKKVRQASLTPQSSLGSCGSLLLHPRTDSESRTPITCYADDLAATVVSMATELAAICLENSTGKQPWFCALKGMAGEGPEAYLIPACRSVLRRKDGQNGGSASKKHRAPRLSEIKRKTEEQPELMERLVNRVVDESVNPDEPPQDPFALFASEVTARIMNCPELNVVDTCSKAGQPRSRLQCERWSRGKASSYESIPEEDGDPVGTPNNTLGPGSRLGQNLSRGSSISKQSSCESITDEFSRFMVNQMETEGRGFDLLLDYYAGKNASNILAAAVQQAACKKNGHLNVKTSSSSCLSKQSSTESITEEFYRFMLRDMDKENKDFGLAKTKEWSNSLFPPSPRTPFCIRQSSVPDRRSSDSRLTVNPSFKANSFDGFARNVRGDTLNIFPTDSVAAAAVGGAGLCKSDSCLYQRGKTDQITDMLIHETWSSSIESLMRKNKIIADPEDAVEPEAAAVAAGDSQPHVQQFANRLAADIVDIGKSALGGQQDVMVGVGVTGRPAAAPQPHVPVCERRRGFKQSHLSCSRPSRSSQDQSSQSGGGPGPRDVPLIHIEGDHRDEDAASELDRTGGGAKQTAVKKSLTSGGSSDRDRPAVAVEAGLVGRDKRSMSASSEESAESWSHVTAEDDVPEETSSFIQLSDGTGTSSPTSLGGPADLDSFCCEAAANQSAVISEATDRGPAAAASRDGIQQARTAGGSTEPRLLLLLAVANCDLQPGGVDPELRLALQWIAASELGIPALHFRRSEDVSAAKLQQVAHLMAQRAWRVADLFAAILRFCQLSQGPAEGGHALSGLFDWLLDSL
ncbi:A-kinase anchor protein SPHKAP isoform X2 [Nelusetta ayraudi]|uniref:A-kinase anchor protein SPHKAP isoform X2 n=1 Tax=Nelusetta ayraudi TaxID=303726 RepID=UPI003F6EFE43